MTTDTTAKKDTQKLQRAIVDGLEDVKAQDIQVFDTEHLSPLFERVIVAWAPPTARPRRWLPVCAMPCARPVSPSHASKVRPTVSGSSWIAHKLVVHIMQPNFRTYYHLEELWGEKPVRMNCGRQASHQGAGQGTRQGPGEEGRWQEAGCQESARQAPDAGTCAGADRPGDQTPPCGQGGGEDRGQASGPSCSQGRGQTRCHQTGRCPCGHPSRPQEQRPRPLPRRPRSENPALPARPEARP